MGIKEAHKKIGDILDGQRSVIQHLYKGDGFMNICCGIIEGCELALEAIEEECPEVLDKEEDKGMNTLVSIQESEGLSWILKNRKGKTICRFNIGDKVKIIKTYGSSKDFIVVKGNVRSIGHDTRTDYINVIVENDVFNIKSIMPESILEMEVIE